MLISIFILLFGLLGVLSLIPVAMLRMNQALTTDRASAVAQAALEEIKVRQGALDPNNWLSWDGTSGSWRTVPSIMSTYLLPMEPAYAIDPWFIARNRADTSFFFPATCDRFPYNGATITMPRVSFVGTSSSVPMEIATAERVFVSHDDLLVNTPDDPSARPGLTFIQTNGAFTTTAASAAVRQIQGNYSWLATVAPSGDPSNPTQFNVAVAVFQNRDTTLPTAPLDPATPGERAVSVDILSAGIGGGEVRLWVESTGPNARPAAFLTATPGQWLLLCGRNASGVNIFCWYRIVAAGEVTSYDPDGAGPLGLAWARDMTLAGPDWNSSWDIDSAHDYLDAQGVLFTNLVTVHTETVEAN